MAKRPTIADLAKETGLGTATIDRALNGRAHVSERSLRRIAEAAEKLGYHASSLAFYRADAARRPVLKLGFVLQKPDQAFYQALATHLKAACVARTDYRIEVKVQFTESQMPEDYVASIESAAKDTSAIAVVGPNLPLVSDALKALSARGMPVFTLLNDVAEDAREGYLGTDNIKVGRIAAWGLTVQIKPPGKLAVFVGHTRWHSHMLRESGFQSYVRQFAPEFEVLPTQVNLDTRTLTQEALMDLLHRHPDLRGIYIAGGGMEGAIDALRESRPPNRVGLVVHELTDISRKALRDRYACLAIETPVHEISQSVVDELVGALRGESAGTHRFFEPRIYGPESI